MKYVAWIIQNMAGIRWNTLIRVVVGITQVVLGLVMIWFSKQFIDVTIRTGSNQEVIMMVALLVSLVVTGILLRQLYYYMTTKANTFQSNSIRLHVFSSLFRRQMYEDQLHSGDVTSRLSKDIDTVADVTTSLLPQFIVTGVQLTGAFLLMYSMDRRLSLALLIITPFVVGFGKLFAHRLRNMTLDIRQQESTIQMQVQEGMEHNAVLRSLGSEQWVTDRLSDMQDQLMGRVLRRTRFTVVTRLMLAFTFSLGYLMAFVWGGLQLRAGVITFGVMTSFLQLVGQIQRPIIDIIGIIPSFIHSTASIDRLDELEDLPTEEQKEPMVMEGQLGVRIEDIDFKYVTGEDEVLHHFSHNFKPGSHTAIVGRTGAGKTTLFRLLLALVSPIKGKLTLYNNHEEHPIDVSTRCNFVFVPQGNTLLSGTIRENLLLANAYATEEEMINALHTAVADFVLELPEGLDARCGERGKGLSEGQAQRIAIARGLLRPGNILLLDEISSSLDMNTEKEMFERLFHNYPQKTMIFITHREKVGELCENRLRIGND